MRQSQRTTTIRGCGGKAGPSHGRRGGRAVRRGRRGGGGLGGRVGRGGRGGRLGRVAQGGRHAPPSEDGLMDNIRWRTIIQEVSISIDEVSNTPIPEQIREMGWERLVDRRVEANINVVREFYHSIDPDTYRNQGVLVRGKRVLFNPHAVNRFFGTEDYPEFYRGFPAANDYVGQISVDVAEELRKYPMKPWRRRRNQHIDHRELSTDLAFWNDFISHSVAPKIQYQKLRRQHPWIILAINRAERFDLGYVMCTSLDWHLLHRRQIVFPCTITALCQLAGVNIEEPTDMRLQLLEPMGARCFARMANTRSDPGYINAADEAKGGDIESDDDDGYGGQIGVLLAEICEGQQQITSRLDGFGKTLEAFRNCLWIMGARLTGIEEQMRGDEVNGNRANHEEVNIGNEADDNMME